MKTHHSSLTQLSVSVVITEFASLPSTTTSLLSLLECSLASVCNTLESMIWGTSEMFSTVTITQPSSLVSREVTSQSVIFGIFGSGGLYIVEFSLLSSVASLFLAPLLTTGSSFRVGCAHVCACDDLYACTCNKLNVVVWTASGWLRFRLH